MLLDTRHPISRGVSRLWRGVTLTIVLSLACCLALVTFQPGASVADDPATNVETPRDEATAGEAQTTSRNAVDPNNSDSGEVHTGNATVPQNAAPPSAKSQSPTDSLPGTADAEPRDPAASNQRKSTAEEG